MLLPPALYSLVQSMGGVVLGVCGSPPVLASVSLQAVFWNGLLLVLPFALLPG